MVRGRIGLLSVLMPATMLLATTACSGVDVGVVVDDPEASQPDDPGRDETAGADSSSSGGPSVGADGLGVPGCGVDFRSALSESSRLTDAVMVDLDDAEVSLSAPERWRVARHDPVLVAIVDPEPLEEGAAVHWVRVAAPALGLVFDGPCVPTAGIATVAEGSPPADCTLTPVEGGIIASWQSEPQAEGRVHVVRDGIVVTTLEAPARGAPDEPVAVALDERVAEHTEPGLVDTGLLQL